VGELDAFDILVLVVALFILATTVVTLVVLWRIRRGRYRLDKPSA
jgi:Na+/serine symporter